MVPHLTTALTGPLLELERRILDNDTTVERWLRTQWLEHTPPFYSSVDLRNAGFKLAPVDTNLFPGGFNNLNPAFLPLCVQAAMSAIEKICPEAQQPAADAGEPHAQPVLPDERGAPGLHPASHRPQRAHRQPAAGDHRADHARPARRPEAGAGTAEAHRQRRPPARAGRLRSLRRAAQQRPLRRRAGDARRTSTSSSSSRRCGPAGTCAASRVHFAAYQDVGDRASPARSASTPG